MNMSYTAVLSNYYNSLISQTKLNKLNNCQYKDVCLLIREAVPVLD